MTVMTTDLTVSFLYFDGCPLAPKARDNILAAIEQVEPGIQAHFEEVDLMAPDTPDDIMRWGSPTILINGEDIIGAERGSACSCRLYASDGGVPTTREIVAAIDRTRSG